MDGICSGSEPFQMNIEKTVLAIGIAAAIGAGSFSAVFAGETRVPTGHAYSPDQQRLPLLNSRRSKIEAQADIYETEIYRSQRETALGFSELKRAWSRDMRAPDFQPRY